VIFRLRLFQIGFDALQRRNTFAFEITFSRSRKHRFGGEAVLDSQTVFNSSLQKLALKFSHVFKTNQPFPKSQIEKLALKFVARRTRGKFAACLIVRRQNLYHTFYNGLVSRIVDMEKADRKLGSEN